MKDNRLFDIFSELDEDMIAEAEPTESAVPIKPRKKAKIVWTRWKKLALSAAAVLLVVAIALPIIPMMLSGEGKFHFSMTSPNDNKNYYYSSSNGESGRPIETDTAIEGVMQPDASTVESGNSYTEIVENDFVKTEKKADSYFSIDAGTASFPDIRSTLARGMIPQKNAVRIEEMLNYFQYDYAEPNEGDLFSLNAALFPTPYNRETYLLTVGLATKSIEFSEVENNLVFLIDVSGSMNSPNKLPLVQESFKLLAENLNPNDRVSIVTYASGDRVALDGAYGNETDKIVATIEDLAPGGSTAGAKGIERAYELAQKYFIEDGNNRVVLMTDGDFNVGLSSTEDLKTFIAEKRDTGVYFSVYGFGQGNLRADLMETLALNGNGVYSYIDSLTEARRALVDSIGGSMVTVAKDVKTGLVFNPHYISEYRLVGFENKQLTEDEFNNTETDAGELGSGHTATVVYEVKLTDQAFVAGETLADLTLKYKTTEDMNRETTMAITTEVYHEALTETDIFVAAVVEFGLLLRDSQYKGEASIESLVAKAKAHHWVTDREEFFDVVLKYQTLLQLQE